MGSQLRNLYAALSLYSPTKIPQCQPPSMDYPNTLLGTSRKIGRVMPLSLSYLVIVIYGVRLIVLLWCYLIMLLSYCAVILLCCTPFFLLLPVLSCAFFSCFLIALPPTKTIQLPHSHSRPEPLASPATSTTKTRPHDASST